MQSTKSNDFSQPRKLNDKHRSEFFDSGISDAIIQAAGIYSANGEIRDILEWMPKGLRSWGEGMVIPFRDLHGNETGYARVKLDFPRTDDKGKVNKYESPRGKPNHIYFPPGFNDAFESAEYIVIAEGEKKALCGMSHGMATVGIVGVYGWCLPRRKDSNGCPIGPKILHPDLAAIVKPGMRIVIVFDSDAATKPEVRTAQRELARSLAEKGATVAIVRLPHPDNGKAGLDDFVVANGDDALRDLIDNTTPLTADDLAGDDVILQNYVIRKEQQGEDTVTVKTALSLRQITEQLNLVTGNWPRRVDNLLFVDDGGRIRWIEDHHDLFATIQSKGGIRWASGADTKGINFVSRTELLSQLRVTARKYEAISEFPFSPARNDTYTTWRAPSGYIPNGEYMDGLLDRFCPSTPIDKALIRTLLLTLLWGGPPGQRPLFFITGDDQGLQEIGKTTLIEKLADTVGGFFKVSLRAGNYNDDAAKQLLSATAMTKRVILLDNKTGVLRSDDLADLITAEHIDGRPAFGRQARRLNLLTWCVTTNDLAMSTDLASRSVVIRLKMPDRNALVDWERSIVDYIHDYRDQIIADGLAALQGQRYPITAKRIRFGVWCNEVLATDPIVDEILPVLQTGIRAADADADEIAVFLSELHSRIDSGTLSAHGNYQPRLLTEIWNEANRDKLTTVWVTRHLNAARSRGGLTSLEPVSKKHGAPWRLVNPEIGELNASPDENASP